MKTPQNIKRMIRERAKAMAALNGPSQAKVNKPRKATFSFRAIASLVEKAKERMGKGRVDESQQLRAEAERLALENLRQRTILHHLDDVQAGTLKDELRRLIDHCEKLLEAMNGEVKTPKPDKIFRFLDSVYEYQLKNGRSPTITELRNFKPTKTPKLSNDSISYVADYLRNRTGKDILEKGQRGPKSS